MSQKQKLKALIQAWMKRIKESRDIKQKTALQVPVQDFQDHKEKLLTKYYHLFPRNF